MRPAFGKTWTGRLQAGGLILRCTLGQSGIKRDKREGDHASPAGTFRLVAVGQRADRGPRVSSPLPVRLIQPRDGWCDDAAAPAYNRPIALPARVGHERLYRSDHVYDVVVVLDHNQYPRIRGRGSAIFFHLMRPDGGGTEGCIAISQDDMRRLLPRLARHVRMTVG